MLKPVTKPRALPLWRFLEVVLWPAFLAAAVLEMLVFAVLDPQAVPLLGESGLAWSSSAVYSVSFLLFWGATAAAAGVSVWLVCEPVRRP